VDAGAGRALSAHPFDDSDDGGGDQEGHLAEQRNRVPVATRATTLEQQMVDALIPRLRAAIGLPSSSAFGKDAARVTATIIGDAASRSRAFVLRYGALRDSTAVLWVSSRGGLLCSCFGGTQDALLLSTSSRSMDCMHTRILMRAMAAGDVPAAALRARMALRADAADFAVARVVGSTLTMYVLWRKVFSAVVFTAKQAACIAPGCRSFSRRCGHVRVARQAREGLEPEKGGVGMDMNAPVVVKVKRDKSSRPRYVTNEEEDIGLEKVASDTQRGDGDAPEAGLSRRRRRNLLACSGEIADGEAWNRTADWKSSFHDMLRVGDDAAENAAAMGVLYASALRRGLVRDTSEGLVESLCGSCGHRRGDQGTTFEPAIMYTHHPTAPILSVCSSVSIGWPHNACYSWPSPFSCLRTA